ncbi:demethylmenaquinone methyltransferase [Actinorhabdospora filicis]|uniref:Putative 4-hydroxy-4-methyl-2-oxoglutarate aldolase n=1 Tax=Actinorhabdospora filicis TaxID=1785913 RepID=A0A9W6SSV9_9ACTN|nr:RraA family protein [Actinorhabdospora filicis]GLZ81345.1 demethylmenaquinone methyltransferase [Actinorhabdospora filicis]
MSALHPGTAAVCDTDKSLRVMAPAIAHRSSVAAMRGTAFTVRCDGDFFGALHALESAAPGDVLVVDGGGREVAYAGELFARAALARGLAGIVVDGGYRDIAYVRGSELPVFSRWVTPMAGTTGKAGHLGVPVVCGGVVVSPGDVVIADEDGLVVLEPSTVEEVFARAAEVVAREERVLAAMAAGKGIGECLNVAEHAARLGAGEASVLRFVV